MSRWRVDESVSGAQAKSVVEGRICGHFAFVELCAELVRASIEREAFCPLGVHQFLTRREFQHMLVVDVRDEV